MNDLNFLFNRITEHEITAKLALFDGNTAPEKKLIHQKLDRKKCESFLYLDTNNSFSIGFVAFKRCFFSLYVVTHFSIRHFGASIFLPSDIILQISICNRWIIMKYWIVLSIDHSMTC